MQVKNKTCIITGSAQGLGKAFAKILLDHGAKVCISDLKEETAMSTLEEFQKAYGQENVCFVKCDVTDEEQFTNLFDETETYFNVHCIDMLVNNAGINTNLGWKKCMNVNIMGVMIGSDIAMKRMKASAEKGHIINISSMAGHITGLGENMIGYSVSKHGVVVLTRTLAAAFKDHGVSNKALCPAWADTEIMSMKHASPESEKAVENSIKRSGGLMTPEFVAEGFYKLVSGCDNGAVMGVMNKTPFFIIPDTSSLKVMMMVIFSKLMGKITGTNLVTVAHEKVCFLIFMILLFCIATWIL